MHCGLGWRLRTANTVPCYGSRCVQCRQQKAPCVFSRSCRISSFPPVVTTVSQRPTGELTFQLGYLLKCFIRWLPALWSAFLTLVTFGSGALFLPRSFNKERVSLPTDTRNTVLPMMQQCQLCEQLLQNSFLVFYRARCMWLSKE